MLLIIDIKLRLVLARYQFVIDIRYLLTSVQASKKVEI